MIQVQNAQLLSPGHIILILAIVLLLFGGKKIPELMKGLGQGIKEFKDASKGEESKIEDEKKS
jgi:sec-independent protein translocase protein TatA